MLQIMHLLLASPGGLKDLGVVDSATMLACYLAAICHDHGHPGGVHPIQESLEPATSPCFIENFPSLLADHGLTPGLCRHIFT